VRQGATVTAINRARPGEHWKQPGHPHCEVI